jgi:hypothetical protein
MVLGDIGNGEVLLWMVELFFFIVWFWLLISIFGDLFRDHDVSGGAKALWVLFVVVVPFLGILVYLIVRGGGMAQRSAKAMQEAQAQFDDYVRQTAGASAAAGATPADQIASAKSLLDSGAISQAEFDQLKAKALS